jgi:hypothetical protein
MSRRRFVNDVEDEVGFEGTLRAFPFKQGAGGKQFLGAIVECDNGERWVLSYEEQSPYHAFAERRVAVKGVPLTPAPESQRLLGVRHLRASRVRLVEPQTDVGPWEVGRGRSLSGQFVTAGRPAGGALLLFETSPGESFLVVNDPPGVTLGQTVEVEAYPVKMSPPAGEFARGCLWICTRCSYSEIWGWRARRETP